MYKFSIFIILLLAFNKINAASLEYKHGYIDCIINEVLPEERLKYSLDEGNLIIQLPERELDPVTKSLLLERLKQTNFFKQIDIQTSTLKDNANLYHTDKVRIHKSNNTLDILPPGSMYDQPIADPKWPKFTAGYQHHFKDTYGKRIFNFSFGENFSLLRYKTDGWSYGLSVQPGVFGHMNINDYPTRLVNTDYFIGVGLSITYDRRWQNLIQLSHLSSHLGDEFLIAKPNYINKRINLSYEAIKWFTAYKFNAIRPYMGIGYLIHKEPRDIAAVSLDLGVDYITENKVLFNTWQYVFGMHMHSWYKNSFKPTLNIRTGIQLSNPIWQKQYLQLLVDYGSGKSRHGQFYQKNEHYIGLLISFAT